MSRAIMKSALPKKSTRVFPLSINIPVEEGAFYSRDASRVRLSLFVGLLQFSDIDSIPFGASLA
jgi:hypothetical protein